jgi:16S rRNA (cytosine967-C5)-methyltransferase
MTATNLVNLRAVVLDILMELEKEDTMSHIVIGNALSKFQYLEKNERGFITRVAQGTIEKRIELDYIINSYSKIPVNKMKPVIRNIMRMSVYQLRYMPNVPASAVCNEAVKLAVKRKFVNLKGFVNGVLRNISRNPDNIKYPDRSDMKRFLSIKYSFPEWLIEMWNITYTYEQIERMLIGFDNDKRTYIRCNTNVNTPDELKHRLEAEGITVIPVKGLSYAFEIKGYNYIDDIEAFKDGCFQIQDISSMLAGEAACIKGEEHITDVCAAPGGKTINAALKLKNGTVDSRDVSDYKVSLIEDNLDRLGIDNVTTKVWDATVVDESAIGRADIVIADVPCSGLGIIGRKPDIKYNTSPEKIAELVKLQRDILSTVQSYVKKGGYLIYSTCTINKSENEDNVKWLCDNYGFEVCPPEGVIKEYIMTDSDNNISYYDDNIMDNNIDKISGRVTDTNNMSDKNNDISYEHNNNTEYGIQLLPGAGNTDGFFICRLYKN